MRILPVALAIAAAVSPALARPVAAQETMPKFYVYGEDDDAADLQTCRVSHQEAIALVKSQLRGAGMAVETNQDAEGPVMDTYVNINALPLDASPASCAYNFELTFETFTEAANPFTGESEFAKLTYCSRGSLMIWQKAEAQQAVHDSLRGYVRDCLAKYRSRNDR